MSKENIFMQEVDKPSALQFSIRLIPKLISLLLRSILFLPLWPLFWLGWLIWYRPPNVPYVKQVLRYLIDETYKIWHIYVTASVFLRSGLPHCLGDCFTPNSNGVRNDVIGCVNF